MVNPQAWLAGPSGLAGGMEGHKKKTRTDGRKISRVLRPLLGLQTKNHLIIGNPRYHRPPVTMRSNKAGYTATSREL